MPEKRKGEGMEDKGNKKEGNGRGTNEEKRVKSGVEESTVG